MINFFRVLRALDGFNTPLGVLSGVAIAIETFLLNLSSPVNCTVLDGQGVGTIQRNPIIPSVTLSRTSGKAPLAVGFDATGTVSGHTTNPSHDLFYAWNFGDAAGETWAYGATVGLDKNAAFGPVAGHVFKSAGTFSWQCVVIDGRGNTATSSGTVTVSAWAAADTIYIANGTLPSAGGDVLAGATYYNRTTWAGVVSLWAANKRIMLKRGDTWACGATTYLADGMEVNAFGLSGANPTVTSAGANQNPFANTAGASDIRLCNLKHVGPGPEIANSETYTCAVLTSANVLLLNVESDGATGGVISTYPSTNNLFIQDCYFRNYAGPTVFSTNIAVFVTHGYGVYLLGSWFDNTSSHTVRLSGVQNCVIDSCKITRPAQSTGSTGHALTIRELNNETGTWLGEFTEKVIVSNCLIDAATSPTTELCVKLTITGDALAGRIRNILFERNYIIASKQCLSLYAEEKLTVRNNILISGNAPVTIGISNGSFATPDKSPDITDAQFYNNTIYTSRAGVYSTFQLGTSVNTISNTVIKNNLVYAPFATSPTLTLNNLGVSNTILGVNSSSAQMSFTRPWSAASPVNPVDYTPTNYALNSGAFDYRSQKDFFNALITAPIDIGAIQV